MLYVGLALALCATALYLRTGLRESRAASGSTGGSTGSAAGSS